MVHWPLIVYAQQIWPTRGTAQSWLIFAATIALGFLSYRFVETPFRKARGVFAGPQIFGAAIASLVLLVGAAAYICDSEGFAARLPQNARALLAYCNNYDVMAFYRAGTCFIGNNATWSKGNTSACLSPAHPSVLLWGDSHSAALYGALDDFFKPHGIALSQASASSCSPFLGATNPNNTSCPAFDDTILDWISRESPDVVILAALWSVNADAAKKLDATVKRLTESGSLVVIIGNTPIYQSPVPEILIKRILLGDDNTLGDNHEIGALNNTDYYLQQRYADKKTSSIFLQSRRSA